MDFNENKLINQIYENDWLIEETYRQSDFHQFHFNNITTQYIVFENCYKFVAKNPHACVWDESHISLDIYLEKNI